MAKGEWVAQSFNDPKLKRGRVVYYKDGMSSNSVLLYTGRGSFNSNLDSYTVLNKHKNAKVLLPWEFLK